VSARDDAARAGRELHPRLSADAKRALDARGRELFARGEFFAAHEAWEEIWRSTDPEPRELFQALVQMAAAFHHWDARARPDVARRVLGKARARLAALPGSIPGVDLDVDALRGELAAWDEWLVTASGAPPPLPDLR